MRKVSWSSQKTISLKDLNLVLKGGVSRIYLKIILEKEHEYQYKTHKTGHEWVISWVTVNKIILYTLNCFHLKFHIARFLNDLTVSKCVTKSLP